MSYFSFNPIRTKSIVVHFSCDSCETPVESEEISVPEPNYMAEKSRDSQVENEGYATCEACDKQFDIDIYVSFGGGDGRINELSDGYCIEVQEIEEPFDESELLWEILSSEQLKIYTSHVDNVEKLLKHSFESGLQYSVLVMLHAHVIAAIELFLSTTFIHEVINSENLIKKLIESSDEFAKRKFTLKEIYQETEKLKITVANYLKNLIFHDLKKIKPMYKDVLEIDFGDISWLFRAILLRHDCTHRAGYDREGNKIDISNESIKELISKCNQLTEKIVTETKL